MYKKKGRLSMKKYFTIIVTCICILSLVLNVVVINKYYEEKNAYDPAADWTDYSVRLRMTKQSDVFYEYSRYLKKIANNTASWDELYGFASAVRYFSNPEIVQGAINIKAGDNEEIRAVFDSILFAGFVVWQKFDEISAFEEEELLEIQQIYADLEYLLNSNNQEKSFTYYVQHDDFTSDESLKVQDEVIKKLIDLEWIFGESVV